MLIANILGVSLILGLLFTITGMELQKRFKENNNPYKHQLGVVLEAIGIIIEFPWDLFITIVAIIYRLAGIAFSDNDIYVGKKKRRR